MYRRTLYPPAGRLQGTAASLWPAGVCLPRWYRRHQQLQLYPYTNLKGNMMKLRNLFAIAGIMAVTPAHADYTVTCPKGDDCGVLSTRIERQRIETPPKGARMMATVDLVANAVNVNATPGRPAMARGSHSACFETWFTTEGDYKFVLDVGGHQTVVTEHIMLPAHERTCVSHELYYNITFPTAGTYQYTASSSAYTQMAGWRTARSDASIFVR